MHFCMYQIYVFIYSEFTRGNDNIKTIFIKIDFLNLLIIARGYKNRAQFVLYDDYILVYLYFRKFFLKFFRHFKTNIKFKHIII